MEKESKNLVITEKIKEEAEIARRKLLRPRGWRAEPPATPLLDQYLKQQQPQQQQQSVPEQLPPVTLDQLYPYH